MAEHGIEGAKRRGRPWRTTKPDPDAQRRPDLVERDFTASRPGELWVADYTHVRCWEGVVFFAFVLDVFSRMVVGWHLAGHQRSELVDALQMGLGTRERVEHVELVHHSDRGSQLGFNRSSQCLGSTGPRNGVLVEGTVRDGEPQLGAWAAAARATAATPPRPCERASAAAHRRRRRSSNSPASAR